MSKREPKDEMWLAYIGDGYLAAAEWVENVSGSPESFFSGVGDEEDVECILARIPSDIAEKVALQGTSDQWYGDGYEAADAVSSYIPESRDHASRNPGLYASGIIDLLGALRPGDRFGWVKVSEIGKRLSIDDVELNYFLGEAERDGLVENRVKGKTTEHRLTSKGAGAYTMSVIEPEEIIYESAKHEAFVEVLYGADVLKGGEVTPIIMITDLGGRKRPGWSVYFPQTKGTIHRAIDGAGYDQGQGWTVGLY